MNASDQHRSRAAIAGHPLHPTVVPLPIGATVLAFLSDLMATRTRDAFWARASRWLLRASAVGSVLAAPLGAVDLLTVPAARGRPAAWLHGGGNLLNLLLVLSEVRRRGGRHVRASEVSPVATGLAVAILGVTGWIGGELSYRYRIGVMGKGGTTDLTAAHRAEQRHDDRSAEPRGLAADQAGAGGSRPGGDAGPWAGDGGGGVGWAAAVIPSAGVDRSGAGEPGALDPGTADAIARELARGEDPVEGRQDVDQDAPWGAGRNL